MSTAIIDRVRTTFSQALLEGDARKINDVVSSSVSSGIPLFKVYTDVFSPALSSIEKMPNSDPGRHIAEGALYDEITRLASDVEEYAVTGTDRALVTARSDSNRIKARIFADLLRLDGWKVDTLPAKANGASISSYIERKDVDVLVFFSDNKDGAAEFMREVSPLPDSVHVMYGGCGEIAGLDIHPIRSISGAISSLQKRFHTRDEASTKMVARVGEQIRKHRQRRGLTQQELADMIVFDEYVKIREDGKIKYETFVENGVEKKRPVYRTDENGNKIRATLSRTYLIKIERGEQANNFSIRLLFRIAEALRVPASSLIDIT